jgi:hypothetical protein
MGRPGEEEGLIVGLLRALQRERNPLIATDASAGMEVIQQIESFADIPFRKHRRQNFEKCSALVR